MSASFHPPPRLCMPSAVSVRPLAPAKKPGGSSPHSDATDVDGTRTSASLSTLSTSPSTIEVSSREGEEDARPFSVSSWSVLRQALLPWNLVDLCAPTDEVPSIVTADSSTSRSSSHCGQFSKPEEEFLVDPSFASPSDPKNGTRSSAPTSSSSSFPYVLFHQTSRELTHPPEDGEGGEGEDFFWQSLFLPPLPDEQMREDPEPTRSQRLRIHRPPQAASENTSSPPSAKHSTHGPVSTDLRSLAASCSSGAPRNLHAQVSPPSYSLSLSTYSSSSEAGGHREAFSRQTTLSPPGIVPSCVDAFFSESTARSLRLSSQSNPPHRLSPHVLPPSSTPAVDEVCADIPRSTPHKKNFRRSPAEAVCPATPARNSFPDTASVRRSASLSRPPPLPYSGSSLVQGEDGLEGSSIENEEVDEFQPSTFPGGGGGGPRAVRSCSSPACGPPSVSLLSHQQKRYAVFAPPCEGGRAGAGKRTNNDGSFVSSSLSSLRPGAMQTQSGPPRQKQHQQEQGEAEGEDDDQQALEERSLSFFLGPPETERKSLSPYKRLFSSGGRGEGRGGSDYSFFPFYQGCAGIGGGAEESLDAYSGGVTGIDDFEVSIVGDPLFEERRPRAEDISGNIMKFKRQIAQRPSLVCSTVTPTTTTASC